MRFLTTLLLGLFTAAIAGCDKPNNTQEQAQTQAKAQRPKATNSGAAGGALGDVTLESASGMTALLTYAHAGTPAPTPPFTGADGRDVTLNDFAGRPLLVNIWATWCAPCKAEMPTLDALAALEAGNISVIAIAQDLQGRAPVVDFFARSDVRNLEPYTDADNALMAAYGNLSLPTTILYDSGGAEIWRVQGGLEWNDAEVAMLLKEAN